MNNELKEQFPKFYLEIYDLIIKPPVLKCIGKKYVKVKGYTDVFLICELVVPMIWANKQIDFIAVSAGDGDSVRNMNHWPYSLAIYIPKKGLDSFKDEDFEGIAKGRAFDCLPDACLEMLGYLKKE